MLWAAKLSLYVLYFAAAAALALRTLAGAGTVETLPTVTCALALGALAGPAANVALHSAFFVHSKFIVRPRLLPARTACYRYLPAGRQQSG